MITVAVASGKGGVGKTTLTANLGLTLAKQGLRVALVDADLGLANLDVVIGVNCELTLQHVLENIVSVDDALTNGPCGVGVLAGTSGVSSMLRLSRRRLDEFLLRFQELKDSRDIVIFDVASGADARVMAILRSVQEVVMVTTPDPSSIVDCYSTIKVLNRYKKDMPVSILINQANDKQQAGKVFEAVQSAAKKFIRKNVDYIGFVREDLRASRLTGSRSPFVLSHPQTPASLDVNSIASRLITRFALEDCNSGEMVDRNLELKKAA